MSRFRNRLLAIALGAVSSCSEPLLPGPRDQSATLDGPIDGLSPGQLGVHAQGDAEFSRVFAPADGLGPIFVATSCESCHVGDGKGHPLFDITRFGRPSAAAFDPMEDQGGPQLQNRAILGLPGRARSAGATDGRALHGAERDRAGASRGGDDATILALADPTDANGDGISGRPSLVDSTDFIADIVSVSAVAAGGDADAARSAEREVRRPLRQEGANDQPAPPDGVRLLAGHGDHDRPRAARLCTIGRSARRRTDGVADPEVSGSTVDAVVFYLRTLRPPPRRDADAPTCARASSSSCRSAARAVTLPTLRTGRSDIPQLDGVEFSPFTDLLLHDMGPDLDDGYTEGDAAPSEWRTAPLWGIGLAESTQGGSAHFLHDGRAKTLREAIGFHGGEGARSRGAFDELSADQQERLLAYLRSL